MSERQLDIADALRRAGGQADKPERFTRPCHFSPCKKYRYTLERVWDFTNPRRAMFIGLNPSTADESKDDPTVRQCRGFAQRWGRGGMFMANIFGYRATDPKIMKEQFDPVGPENDEALLWMAGQADFIVACWGNHGTHFGRARWVLENLDFGKPIHALKITGKGQPHHPLYIKRSTRPFALECPPKY